MEHLALEAYHRGGMGEIRLESHDEAQYGSAIRSCHVLVLYKVLYSARHDAVRAQMEVLQLTRMNKEDAIPLRKSFRARRYVNPSWTRSSRG